MKITKLLTCTLLILNSPINHLFSTCSHTFFTPRMISQDAVYENALDMYSHYYADTDTKVRYMSKFLYQQSTRKQDIANYFLPKNKSCIRIDEEGNGDVNPLWTQVVAPPLEYPPSNFYTSNYGLCPDRRVFGTAMHVHVVVTNNLWFSIFTAFVGARHHLCPQEWNRTSENALERFKTFRDSMNNPDFEYGRITPASYSRAGIDDIQIKLGYNIFRNKESHHLAPYILGSIPTGSDQCCVTMFEPVMGSRHTAIGAGLSASWRAYQNENSIFSILFDGNYRYAFEHEEFRSFDTIKNGEWSRYMLVAKKSDPDEPLPAINYFAQCVNVTPRGSANIFAALHLERGPWDVEAGYNFWWREAEKVCLCPYNPASAKASADSSKNKDEIGIFDLAGAGSNNTTTSASTANISQAVTGDNTAKSDNEFTTIDFCNFNTCSAAHPRTWTHKLYGAFSYSVDREDYSYLFGFGGSYEFNRNCTSLEQWAVWLSTGFIW